MEKILDNKWLKIGLLSVTGLVLAGGVAFAGYKLRQKQSQPTPTLPLAVSFSLVPQPEAGSPSAETANWKTYTNFSFSYTLKYPPSFSTEELGAGTTVLFRVGKEEKIPIRIEIKEGGNPEKKTGEEWMTSYYKDVLGISPEEAGVLREVIFIGGIKGTKVIQDVRKLGLPLDEFDLSVFLTKETDVYQFILSTPERDKKELQSIFDLILSTFKFLD